MGRGGGPGSWSFPSPARSRCASASSSPPPALADAVAALADSPYGRYVRRGMTLEEAERAVERDRPLAPPGPGRLGAGAQRDEPSPAGRAVRDREHRGPSAAIRGRPIAPPFELGSLALSWPRLSTAASAGELRQRLTASTWGDPAARTSERFASGFAWRGRPRWQTDFPSLRPTRCRSARAWSSQERTPPGWPWTRRRSSLARRCSGPRCLSGPDTSLPGTASLSARRRNAAPP